MKTTKHIKKTMVPCKNEKRKGKTRKIELRKETRNIYTKLTKSLGLVMNMIF